MKLKIKLKANNYKSHFELWILMFNYYISDLIVIKQNKILLFIENSNHYLTFQHLQIYNIYTQLTDKI